MSAVHPTTSAVRSITRTAAAAGLLLGGLAFLAGCATPPSAAASNTPARPATSPDEHLPIERLQKGLPAERVSALIGPPTETKLSTDQGLSSEIWTYTRTIAGPVRQVAAETRDVPVVDPITGAMRTVPEPVYKNQRTYYTEKTELLMIDGRLVAWKQRRSADSTEYQ